MASHSAVQWAPKPDQANWTESPFPNTHQFYSQSQMPGSLSSGHGIPSPRGGQVELSGPFLGGGKEPDSSILTTTPPGDTAAQKKC